MGIDGPGGAGKSTLARELALLRDDVTVIAGDDFYRPLPERMRESLTPIEAVDLTFDWERLRDEVLGPLLRGEHARYRRYDWASGRLGEDLSEVAAEEWYFERQDPRRVADVVVDGGHPGETREHGV